LKIFKAEVELTDHNLQPGAFETDGRSYLKFAGLDGFIWVKELQLEGKKRMDTGVFLRGHRFTGN
jgi:methionyl-tRNA formyltransferase